MLPPLVLGYDELYEDVKDEEATKLETPLRSLPDVIDTKGRRTFDSKRNFRSLFKEQRSRDVEKQPIAENVHDDINLENFNLN